MTIRQAGWLANWLAGEEGGAATDVETTETGNDKRHHLDDE